MSRDHRAVSRNVALLAPSLVLAACGGGQSDTPALVDPDYSSLRVAESREGALAYAGNDEQVLAPLRNGLRLWLGGGAGGPVTLAGVTAPAVGGQGSFSGTTVQIDGVDEGDLVKYDGRHIYVVRPVPAAGQALSRNVLEIVRTDPASAGFEELAEFVMEGEQNGPPLLYQLRSEAGATEYLATVSRDFQGWLLPLLPTVALALQPDRTVIQLVDVRDPRDVAQVWKLELDGWLRASRQVGDVLYLVQSYRPRLPDVILPADTIEKRAANEHRIRTAAARDLLPRLREGSGVQRQLATPRDCVVAADVASHEGYTDLVVIAAVSLGQRRVIDVNCVSTNISGVFMSPRSLYVSGEKYAPAEGGTELTVLHKFALDRGDISYRASGAVRGSIGWSNPSYFLDEHNGDLRIVTTQHSRSGDPTHHLSVLRETPEHRLVLVSTLPNAERPAPIGKPREQLHAVRFLADRAYVVTARIVDPLYVIDLTDPAAPCIAGELEIPGISTYLRPLGPPESQLLLAVGLQMDAAGLRQGVKVELFDVRDIGQPRSIGAQAFGTTGTWSEAVSDPHALTFLKIPGDPVRHRLALPITVVENAEVGGTSRLVWSYSGLHLLEVAGIESGSPTLHFQGVIKTQEPDSTTLFPSFAVPDRGVLHDDSVFAIHGDRIRSSLWGDIK